MLAYVTIGTNNKEKAVAFYAELLGELGAKQLFNNERLVFFGTDMTTPMIAVGTPFDGEAATNGNISLDGVYTLVRRDPIAIFQ